MFLVMTQAEFDLVVTGMGEEEVRIAYKACQMRRQNDPEVFDLEEKLMMLQNIIAALIGYDVTYDWLTDAEINDYIELATQIIQCCPM